VTNLADPRAPGGAVTLIEYRCRYCDDSILIDPEGSPDQNVSACRACMLRLCEERGPWQPPIGPGLAVLLDDFIKARRAAP